jgi:hypothetical protein
MTGRPDPLQLDETAGKIADAFEVPLWLVSDRHWQSYLAGKRHRRRRQLAAAFAVGIVAGLLVGNLITKAAAPRPAPNASPAGISAPAVADDPSERTAASSSYPSSQVPAPSSSSAVAGAGSSGGAGIIPPACSGPCPTLVPRIRTAVPRDGIGGWATWYDVGPGLYGAINPRYGDKGGTAVVCGGSPFHCKTIPLVDVCACGNRHGKPTLIDLSPAAFREFAPTSRGVTWVTLQVLR